MHASAGFATLATEMPGSLTLQAEGTGTTATSEGRFRLLPSLDHAIVLLDSEGHGTSWNLGAERITGYRPEEIVGEHFSCFYLPEDIEAGKPATALAEATARGRFDDEGGRLRKDGSRFLANVVLTALRDDAG